MLRFLYVASFAGCLLASADAAEPETTSAAPTQAYVRINASGELEVLARRLVYVHEEKQRSVMVKETQQEPRNQTVKVTRDGKTFDETTVVTVEVEVMVPMTETYEEVNLRDDQYLERFPASTTGFFRRIDNTELAIYDLAGERLSMKAVEDRLHEWTLVLISKTGKALDRRYADLFKPTTIVVGIPSQIPPLPFNPSSKTPVAAAAPTTKRQARPASKPDEIRVQLPTAPQPTFAFAGVRGEKTIALRTEDETLLHLTRTVFWQHDGAPERIQKTVETRETLKFPTSKVSATKVPNEDVTTAELESVLKAETLAVMSADGKPVDPFWLQNLQEGALVVVAPVDPAWKHPPNPFFGPRMGPVRRSPPTPTEPQAVPRRPGQ